MAKTLSIEAWKYQIEGAGGLARRSPPSVLQKAIHKTLDEGMDFCGLALTR